MLSLWVVSLAASSVFTAILAGSATARCPSSAPSLTCTLSPTTGSPVGGNLTLTPISLPSGHCGSSLNATITGLAPGAVHGWHIHEAGDISAPDGTATGGHFNPGNREHGLPNSWPRHVGDLGNLPPADAGGVTAVEGLVAKAVATGAVVGRGLIIHASPDNGGQPTGNAGGRLAQCVLGVARVPPPA